MTQKESVERQGTRKKVYEAAKEKRINKEKKRINRLRRAEADKKLRSILILAIGTLAVLETVGSFSRFCNIRETDEAEWIRHVFICKMKNSKTQRKPLKATTSPTEAPS